MRARAHGIAKYSRDRRSVRRLHWATQVTKLFARSDFSTRIYETNLMNYGTATATTTAIPVASNTDFLPSAFIRQFRSSHILGAGTPAALAAPLATTAAAAVATIAVTA